MRYLATDCEALMQKRNHKPNAAQTEYSFRSAPSVFKN